MTEFLSFRDSRSDAEDKRERAILSFLDLGERLKSAKQKPTIGEGLDVLLSTIEGDIIPRLMLTHKAAVAATAARAEDHLTPSEQDKAQFLWIVMNESAASSRAFVNALLGRGIAREAIYLDLLTDAARRLGEMWELDQCDFTDVTIGLCRLHQVLREQSSIYGAELSGSGESPRVLFATACGDQHVFGLVMVSEFFRREGWRVWCEPGAARDQLTDLLGREWFDMIGLSAACSADADDIADEIADLRAASLNPSVAVMVGGSLFLQHPDLVARVGADGTAADARLAAEAGRNLLVSAPQQG